MERGETRKLNAKQRDFPYDGGNEGRTRAFGRKF